jgi:hypothetical protein
MAVPRSPVLFTIVPETPLTVGRTSQFPREGCTSEVLEEHEQKTPVVYKSHRGHLLAPKYLTHCV